ncbi:ribosomal protein S6 glutaminyl transferase [Pseudomonas phage NV1]|uniref:Putative ATP-grasp enzyme n=1 Tax=Pseudomonas phage NV1 TaxID=2079543 RepID=A0A2L0HPL7_9CAUD|nr:ribosomal protein S6 glutaminyl transferase [Pseudomonas phage NV1]AUX83650.1 putative ATP-grasp enzyme [Pseudomonas phage NV1]
MQFNIFKGDRPSNGARNLQEALAATMLKSEGSAYTGRRESCVINWGCTNAEAERLANVAQARGRKFYNHPAAVRLAVDKLAFQERLSEVAADVMIPYATNFEAAVALMQAGSRMYARTVLNSHSGKGIVMMVPDRETTLEVIRRIRDNNIIPVYTLNDNVPDEVVRCKLFTQGISGSRTEFRVHIFDEEAILIQQKRRREGAETIPGYNSIVRNVASGWIYSVNNVQEQGKNAAVVAARKALSAIGLDFGAVDIVYKHDTDKAYVLEVNTAPGLDEDGSALTAYTEAFKNV